MAEAKRRKGRTGKGASSDRAVKIQLAPAVELLHGYITEALCQQVFRDVRGTERQRKWSLFALARFWLAAVLVAPRSLSQLLELMRGRELEGFLPEVSASAESFFQKCKKLSFAFFAELHDRFIALVEQRAPKSYAGEVKHLQEKFTRVYAIDGSRLDKIAHRLKILWDEKAVVLPGCITALYDLFRGYTKELWFDPDAASSEFNRAFLGLERLLEGTLLLGDRLYCSLQIFEFLEDKKCFGLFRKTKTLSSKPLRKIATTRIKEGVVEDWLVEAGTEDRARTLRLIRLTRGSSTYEAVTNVLDPERLTALDVVALYPMRWQIERMFYDLKIVLNLQRFHAANPNAVAMQVYAAAMVHAAFRIAQAEIANEVGLRPEDLSPQKLYPLLAFVSIKLIESEYLFDETCKANRGMKLRKPSWRKLPGTIVSLKYIRVQRRSGVRKQREYDPERRKWKSLKNIDGASELT